MHHHLPRAGFLDIYYSYLLDLIRVGISSRFSLEVVVDPQVKICFTFSQLSPKSDPKRIEAKKSFLQIRKPQFCFTFSVNLIYRE